MECSIKCTLLIFTFSINYLFIAPTLAQTTNNKTCSLDNTNAQYIDDNVLYWCDSRGQKVPLACMAPGGSRIDVGSDYWLEPTIIGCKQTSPDTLALDYEACLKRGQRIDVNEKLRDGWYFYKCIRLDDGSVRLDPSGCADADGKEVPLGTEVNLGTETFTCDATKGPNPNGNGGNSGNSENNGNNGNSGNTNNGAGTFVTKAPNHGGTGGTCTDPQTPGKTYAVGDTWHNDFIQFRCEKRGAGLPSEYPVGCVEKFKDGHAELYSPGQKWLSATTGDASNKYVMECRQNGFQIKKDSYGCYFDAEGQRGVLLDGCMKDIGRLLIQCWPPIEGEDSRLANNRIKITNTPVPANELAEIKQHVHECELVPLSSVISPPQKNPPPMAAESSKPAPAPAPHPHSSNNAVSQPRPQPQPQEADPVMNPQPQPSPQGGPSGQGASSGGCTFQGQHIDEEKLIANIWYKCVPGNSKAQIYGCVDNDGNKHAIGETWHNKFVQFRCEKVGAIPIGKSIACVEDYLNGTFGFFPPGRKWLSATYGTNNNYIMQCIQDQSVVRRKSFGCYFHTNEGQGVLLDACMKQVGPILIQCWPLIPGMTANNRIKTTDHTPSKEELDEILEHVKYCDSVPLSSVIN